VLEEIKMTYESELTQKLKTMPKLTLTSVHMGLDEKTEDVPDSFGRKHTYLQDKWSVTVFYNGKDYTAEYSAGIGNRKLISSAKKEDNRYYECITGQFKTEKEACKAQWLKLVPPTLPDVMYCLLSDGRCAEGTFEDFCSELGYNNDSISALNTYLACQKIRTAMIKMLGLELFNELSQLEH
jgi:hypothetical protein